MQIKISDDFADWLVTTRRRFHQIPELAYTETKTMAAICDILEELGVPYESGIATTGVVARLKAKTDGPVVAFRADMDALPLDESDALPYHSLHPGHMHACGHDGHMTIALGVIRLLLQQQWPQTGQGEIVFIFQPAEEGGGGAKTMLDAGVFDDLPIGAVFAGHMAPELAAGHVGVISGPAHAATNTLTIRLQGKGGHGAYPNQCKDPIVAAAYLVTQLQTLVSRDVDPIEPAVLTFGQFHAGTACNIIPETVFLNGTLRTLSAQVRQQMLQRIEEMVRHQAAAFGMTAEFENEAGYPVMINYPQPVALVQRCAEQLLGAEAVHACPAAMVAEDFAYFSDRWKGMMLKIGCHDPREGFLYGLHSPHFNMDERALSIGVAVFAHILTEFLDGMKA